MHAPQKAVLIEKAKAMAVKGISWRKIGYELGVKYSTLHKLVANDGKPPKRKGRPPGVSWTEHDILLAKKWRLFKESITMAARFMMEDPACSRAVADYLHGVFDHAAATGREPQFSTVARNAFYVTESDKDHFHGQKVTHLNSMSRDRSMTASIGGLVVDILPGELFEMDDYSSNQPYWWHDRETGTDQTGRQVLAAIDVCSAGWLGFDMVARPRDAYRGEDVIRFMGRIFRTNGLPKYLRLENGIWNSDYVHGLEIEGMAKRWGDLGNIMYITHAKRAPTKGTIEGSFSHLQKWLRHTGLDIGRERGIQEAATKAMRHVQNTGRDAGTLGVLSIDQSLEVHSQCGERMNMEPRTRQHLGGERISAVDLKARLGWHSAPLTDDIAWYFLPYKRTGTVQGGVVRVNPGKETGWPAIKFTINGQISPPPIGGTLEDLPPHLRHLHIENGHRLLVAWDPANPAIGAYVCNAEPAGSPKNRHRFEMGQFICQAPHHAAVHQISINSLPFDTGKQKASRSAARTAFKAIGTSGTEKSIYDTAGNAITIRSGMEELKPADDMSITTPREDAPALPSRGGRGMRAAPAPEACARRPLTDTERAELEAMAYGEGQDWGADLMI